MRILITGATGFAGGHLVEALLARGATEIVGSDLRDTWSSGWKHLEGRITLRTCNLCDRSAVDALLGEVKPDQVYHLAGYASAGRSFKEVDAAWAGNLTTTLNLYESVKSWGGRPRILWVGSGLVYGDPESADQLFHEESPLRPTNPYAASKAAADLASYQYSLSDGLDIVRARPFNHIGPNQSPLFAVAHFCQQIAAIERGRKPAVLETGNLAPMRDLSDVRDVAQGYIRLMERGRRGEAYNIATGQALPMQAVVEQLLSLARVPVEVRQKVDPDRTTDALAVRGDAGKLRRETGWAPQYGLEQALAHTLAFWRSQP